MNTQRKHKEHTNYASAFAIGEHAELRLDFQEVNRLSLGRIEGIELGVNGITYTVAVAVNAGTTDKPEYEFHSGRPLIGVDMDFLKLSDSNIRNDLKGKYQNVHGAKFQVGDVVEFVPQNFVENVNPIAIPVLIYGVSYTAGKVMYDVSIDADEYHNTIAQNSIDHRWLRHSIDRIDSIFITPVGGWELEE